jgi:cell division septation protein DedD
MKSNSLLTYILYGLLGAFILAAGYYACQKQKEQKEQAAREAAELEETLRDMGYASEDTTAATGSSYVSKDTLSKSGTTTKPATKPSTTVSKNGIEEPTATTPAKTVPKQTAPIAKIPAKTVAPSTNTPAKTVAPAVEGPGGGRWAVRAGTFAYMDGARSRLEEVIKAGYPNAEISKTKEGKAAVIVFRSNDKAAAERIVAKLKTKGIDAAIFDRNK